MTQIVLDFKQHLATFEDDLSRLREVMRANLGANVSLIADMEGAYLLGGKCVRGIVALLAGRLCKLPTAAADTVAACIEFIHTASLIHDDIIDAAPLRRHLPSAAAAYGSDAAVLAGDFLYSRASQMLAGLNNIALLQCIADATNKLSEGEILQLLCRNTGEVDEADYYTIIEWKTANLFEAAAAAAALLIHTEDAPLRAYGRHLGIAFQLIDDCLDYDGDDGTMGKKLGADFNQGKITLPIILALAKIDDQHRRQWLLEACRERRQEAFDEVLHLVRASGVLNDIRVRAEKESALAVAALLENYPPSPERDALTRLADSLSHRSA